MAARDSATEPGPFRPRGVVLRPACRDNGARMRPRDLLWTRHGEPRLFLPALVALVITFVAGWGALRVVQRSLPDEERALSLTRTGKFAAAEALYVRLLGER